MSRKLLARGKAKFERELPLNQQLERRKSQGFKLDKYANNPVGFAKDILGIDLTEDQKLILNTLMHSSEVNVQSSHGQGKTVLGAICVLHHVFSVGGLAVTTAPTGRQTKELLWGEIRKLHAANKHKLGGVCQVLALKLNESARAIGFSSQDSNEHAAQGFHSEFLLCVLDESCGISRAIDEGLSSCLTGENNRILRIGNPVEPGTAFEEHCKRNSIKLPAWRHPNVSWAYHLYSDGIHRLKPEVQAAICNLDGSIKPQKQWGKWANKKIIPGAISVRWIEMIRSKYQEKSPYWTSRVEGMFPVDNADGFIPLSWLLEARNRFDSNPDYWEYQASLYPWRVGIDVSDGGDNHAIAIWRGPVLYSVEIIAPLNDRQDTLRLAKIASDKFKVLGGDILCAVDNVGVGAGSLAKLLELGWHAVGCKFGEGAEERGQFTNRKAELYWQFREKLRLGEYAIAPLSNQDYVFQDLSATRYITDTRDKIGCESKAKTVQRLKRSPDSEAAVIALENSMGLMVQPTFQNSSPSYTSYSQEMEAYERQKNDPWRDAPSIKELKKMFDT